MPYDVFISYSHSDDDTHGDWIQTFVDRLERLYKTITGYHLNVFFDREDLQTGMVLSAKIEAALKETRLFVPFLTPSYLESKWCRKEFLTFMSLHKDRLIESGQSRIVPIRLMPHEGFRPTPDIEAEVTQIRTFLAETEVLYLDFVRNGLPVPTTDPEFQNKIAELARTIAIIFNAITIPQQPPAPVFEPQVAITPEKQGTSLDALKSQIQELVADNELAAALEILKAQIKTSRNNYHTVIQLQGQLRDLNSQVSNGIISFDQKNVSFARLSNNILTFLSLLSERDLA